MKKPLTVLLCFAVIALAAWIYKYKFDEQVRSMGGYELPDLTDRTVRPPPETPEQTLTRFRVEARQVASDYVSNKVVGFRRIRYVAPDTSSDVVTNWTGIAEAEFINQLGGVSLTTVDFQFYLGRSGKILYAGENYAKRIDEINGAFWRGFGITNRPPSGWPTPKFPDANAPASSH